ncbi:hypothetical protein ES703_38476 [subsurface metagenome]
MTKFSFIIPVTREQDCLLLLASIRENILTEKSDLEIILVVDTNSKLDIKSFGIPNVKIVKTSQRHPSIRRNLGVRNSTGCFLSFLDDDVVIGKEWIKTNLEFFEKGYDIICGPIIGMRNTISEKISDMVLTSIIGEADFSHKRRDKSTPAFDEIYLCNCSLRRKVWEDIDGFNEKADYHVDDTEFFYIALKMGFKAIFLKRAIVKHRRKEFPFVFLKHQFSARKATGMNTVLFPELFLRMAGIKTILLSYLIIPLFLILGLFKILILIYLGTILFFSLVNVKKYKLYVLILPFAFLANHLALYIGFSTGLFKTLINRRRFIDILNFKRMRYAKI